jgi:hypothetical protein
MAAVSDSHSDFSDDRHISGKCGDDVADRLFSTVERDNEPVGVTRIGANVG